MKKSFVYLWSVIFCSLFLLGNVFGQGTTTLRVIDMPGFPDLPLDSAYEGTPYAFDIRLVNGTNMLINTPLEIRLKVDSIETTITTLAQPNLLPGDSATISVTGYDFTQPQYKIGNNIVVVWPVVNGVVIPIDSLITTVNFIPLSGLPDWIGGEGNQHLYFFPNPSKGEIMFKHWELSRVEYVRIFSITGSLVFQSLPQPAMPLNISFLNPGVYIIEVVANGKKGTGQLVVE